MTFKGEPGGASAAAVSTTPAAWNWGTQIAQQQFAVGAKGAATLVRGLEAMRKIQAQATQQAIQRHAAATHTLGASSRPAATLAVRSELLGEALEVGNELACLLNAHGQHRGCLRRSAPFHPRQGLSRVRRIGCHRQ